MSAVQNGPFGGLHYLKVLGCRDIPNARCQFHVDRDRQPALCHFDLPLSL